MASDVQYSNWLRALIALRVGFLKGCEERGTLVDGGGQARGEIKMWEDALSRFQAGPQAELRRLREENERLKRVHQRLESENQTMSLRLNSVETRLWELEHGKNCACLDCAAAPHGDLLG